MHKRANGEGTIYQRASDGRWLGVLVVGYTPEGRPIRKTVSARTRAEAGRKFRELQNHVDAGLPVPDASVTVASLIKRWHEDVLSHQVAPSAAANYMSVATHHIIPILGRKRLKDLTGLPPVWLTSLVHGVPVLEGCPHGQEVPERVQGRRRAGCP